MVKKEITACPRCGSTNLRFSSAGHGFDIGVAPTTVSCRECEWTGNPMNFESEKDYKRFREAKKEEWGSRTEKTLEKSENNTEDMALFILIAIMVCLMILFGFYTVQSWASTP